MFQKNDYVLIFILLSLLIPILIVLFDLAPTVIYDPLDSDEPIENCSAPYCIN